jgi:hypothetical protein
MLGGNLWQEMEQEPEFSTRVGLNPNHIPAAFLLQLLIGRHFRWHLEQAVHIHEANHVVGIALHIVLRQYSKKKRDLFG